MDTYSDYTDQDADKRASEEDYMIYVLKLLDSFTLSISDCIEEE